MIRDSRETGETCETCCETFQISAFTGYLVPLCVVCTSEQFFSTCWQEYVRIAPAAMPIPYSLSKHNVPQRTMFQDVCLGKNVVCADTLSLCEPPRVTTAMPGLWVSHVPLRFYETCNKSGDLKVPAGRGWAAGRRTVYNSGRLVTASCSALMINPRLFSEQPDQARHHFQSNFNFTSKTITIGYRIV